ncbi:hypothetical protein HKCCE3408_08495 [Rhodobacterales bacterium HKCCE3408]|nr:hypothetical protein [Rhodobacterales bacterium HKCCE3408]
MSLLSFVSSLSARVIGLSGLVAAAIVWQIGAAFLLGSGADQTVVLAVTAFLGLMSLFFLVPGLHDLILRGTLPAVPRIVFILVSAAFVAICGLSFVEFTGQPPIDLPVQVGPDEAGIAALVVGALWLLTYVIGIGYRALRLRVEAEVTTFSPRRSGVIEIGNGRTVTDYAAMFQSEAEKERVFRPELRDRDMLDFLSGLIVLLLVVSAVAMRLGSSVQSEALADWLLTHRMQALGAAGFAALIVVMNGLMRAPATERQARRSLMMRLLGVVIFLPALAWGLFSLVPHDGLPTAWNLITDNEEATITYRVVEVMESRNFAGCALLALDDRPELEMMTCAFDPAFAAGLTPGDRVSITGELSPYAHTFETATLLSRGGVQPLVLPQANSGP